MTIAQALESAQFEDAPLLLAFVLEKNRAWLLAHDDEVIEASVLRRFKELSRRRIGGEPMAYIVGSAGFYGREFTVNAHVLVPRPETEHLIDNVLVSLNAVASPRILDVGTGSGAIGLTLAAELPNAALDAVDISVNALDVARANAKRLGIEARTNFFLGDLIEPVRSNRYHAIVANLPYVPTNDIAASPDPVSFEPRLALDGGIDGLDLYRRLLGGVQTLLFPGGILLMEAAPPNMDLLVALAREAFPKGEVTVGQDYGERERFVKVETTH